MRLVGPPTPEGDLVLVVTYHEREILSAALGDALSLESVISGGEHPHAVEIVAMAGVLEPLRTHSCEDDGWCQYVHPATAALPLVSHHGQGR